MIDDPQENFNVAGELAYAEVRGVNEKVQENSAFRLSHCQIFRLSHFQIVIDLSKMLRAGWREALPTF